MKPVVVVFLLFYDHNLGRRRQCSERNTETFRNLEIETAGPETKQFGQPNEDKDLGKTASHGNDDEVAKRSNARCRRYATADET